MSIQKIDYKHFAKVIRTRRQDLRYTQTEAARLAGCSRRLICDIERGERTKLPPVEMIAAIASVLCLTFKDLFPAQCEKMNGISTFVLNTLEETGVEIDPDLVLEPCENPHDTRLFDLLDAVDVFAVSQ